MAKFKLINYKGKAYKALPDTGTFLQCEAFCSFYGALDDKGNFGCKLPLDFPADCVVQERASSRDIHHYYFTECN